MNAIEDMHEVRFSNIYILSHISYYIHPLTIIIALAIKTVEVFAIQYGDIKDWIWFFYMDFLLFQTKKFISSRLKRWKEKHENIEFISYFKYT